MDQVNDMPLTQRMACYYRVVVRQGASVDWRTGEVTWPRRKD